jgi:hypothetical protein
MLKSFSAQTNVLGALNYKGTWDATANSPALASSVGTKGDYYVVSTAGSTALNGISNWGIGDWAVFNGSVWQRVEGGADLNGVNLTVSGNTTLGGPIIVTPDNTYDIGASGATRPRNIYVGSVTYSTLGFRMGRDYEIRWTVSNSDPTAGAQLTLRAGSFAADALCIGGVSNSFPAITRNGAGISITGGAGGSTAHIKVPGVTVANLPAAATAGAGARAFVTDALAPVFGSAVAGSGAVNVPVYSDGAAWNVG